MLAAHVLGYVGEINDTELKGLKDKGYQPGDEIGKSGVEQAYEQNLRGTPGRTVYEVDPQAIRFWYGPEKPIGFSDAGE